MQEEQSASEKNPTEPGKKSTNPANPLPAGDAGKSQSSQPTPQSQHPIRRAPNGGGERRARARSAPANKDISHVLKGWDYESGTIHVRKVAGVDGTPKLQM